MTHAFWVARARGFRQKPAGMLHALSSWTVLEKVGISRCWVRYGAGLGLGACGTPGSSMSKLQALRQWSNVLDGAENGVSTEPQKGPVTCNPTPRCQLSLAPAERPVWGWLHGGGCDACGSPRRSTPTHRSGPVWLSARARSIQPSTNKVQRQHHAARLLSLSDCPAQKRRSAPEPPTRAAVPLAARHRLESLASPRIASHRLHGSVHVKPR